jgi:hypothetical protein
MKKILSLLLVFTVFTLTGFTQKEQPKTIDINGTEYVKFDPSDSFMIKVKNGLRARNALIKLRTHPRMNLEKEQYNHYKELIESLEQRDDFMVKDCVTIKLKSGLSWKLEENPPAKPSMFNFKLLTESGRNRPEVINYLEYLQFCYKWKEKGEMPTELVENFNRYYTVICGNETCLDMFFEVKFKEDNTTEITDKTIKISDDFPKGGTGEQ